MSTKKRLSGPEARARILEAAARAFRQHGLGATVDQISTEAGYSTSALYKHFANRDAILQALAVEVRSRMKQVYTEEPPIPLRFEDRLRWVMSRLTNFVLEDPDFFFAVHSASPGLRSVGPPDQDELLNQHISYFTRVMQQGIDEEVLSPTHTAESLALVFTGILDALGTRWGRNQTPAPEPIGEQALDIFMNGARQKDS
ncbi:TetR/AcrR family transcriptional regulator [Microvenator marinus]|uniref:TetR/AcrR family transcriptional regulator n=1 Tax=Microvenator marinus TaxID=2600177 RepID=UPI00201B797C|nr:TetR/AcrR family transcriptional regulator [Microvenator marinus]